MEQWLALTAGQGLAFIAAIVVTARHGIVLNSLRRLHFFGTLISFFFVIAVAIVPSVVAAWLLIHVLRWISTRGTGAQERDELDANRATDAERFHWLAVWASLTGHEKFRRRMLKQANQLGFENNDRPVDSRR